MAEKKDSNKVPEAALILPRGKKVILQAEDTDYKRGLIVELLDNGGYEMAYWYDKPDKPYPVEILVDGQSIKEDGKLVEMKFHPQDYYDKQDLEEIKGKAAPYGSGYERVKKVVDESLRDWFKKENWVRINTSGNISGDCGTMKKGKATTRCLPKKKAQSLTKAERKATVAKKVRGDKKGKQFVKNTKKAEYKKK
jgi:hypothetical protein|tara:strand:+ start:252 stop:836 length:585 start_codon:yes stop_codon:yes gene_type:complete